MWSRNQKESEMCQRFQKSRIFGARKRHVEVLRRANAEQVADGDGKRAVAGEIEEEIKGVSIHVADHLSSPPPVAASDPAKCLSMQRRDDEFVEEAAEEPLTA